MPVMGPFTAFMGKTSVLRRADKRLGGPGRAIVSQAANPLTVLSRPLEPDTYRAPATQALSTPEAPYMDGTGRGGSMQDGTHRIAPPGTWHGSRRRCYAKNTRSSHWPRSADLPLRGLSADIAFPDAAAPRKSRRNHRTPCPPNARPCSWRGQSGSVRPFAGADPKPTFFPDQASARYVRCHRLRPGHPSQNDEPPGRGVCGTDRSNSRAASERSGQSCIMHHKAIFARRAARSVAAPQSATPEGFKSIRYLRRVRDNQGRSI